MHFRFKLPPLRCWGAPALVALLAGIAVLLAIDPSGDYPNALQGPGLTLDESFNVHEGVRLVKTLPDFASGAITLDEAFGPAGFHNPDHPPLGRLWIGVFHRLTRWLFPPREHETFSVTACARTAPAAAFVLLVFVVGCAANNWYGREAGIVAAVAVVLMPRLFGHAHLASLETFIGLTYAATVLVVAAAWSAASPPRRGCGKVKQCHGLRPRRPTWRTACWTGGVFGLALLTKIQATLLPIPIALWALCHWRLRALLPLLLFGGVGFLVFFLGWPWLWLDPVAHLKEYLGRATERATLYTWYFGRRYADRDVPWHYPAVMFLTTVPVGLHLLGFCGLFSGERPPWKERRGQIVLGCTLFPLVLFSLPRIAVYDGSRLFLVVFPLWAMFVGRGGGFVLEKLRRHWPGPKATVAFALFLALQAYGLIALWPCHLSYYNLAVGGLRGADRLGLEPTYWGDSVTRSFLQETANSVPAGTTIAVMPVLHQFQLDEMLSQSPILRRRGIRLVPFGVEPTRYVLVFRRKADLPESWRDPPPRVTRLAEVRRQNVLLAALYWYRLLSQRQPKRAALSGS